MQCKAFPNVKLIDKARKEVGRECKYICTFYYQIMYSKKKSNDSSKKKVLLTIENKQKIYFVYMHVHRYINRNYKNLYF